MFSVRLKQLFCWIKTLWIWQPILLNWQHLDNYNVILIIWTPRIRKNRRWTQLNRLDSWPIDYDRPVSSNVGPRSDWYEREITYLLVLWVVWKSIRLLKRRIDCPPVACRIQYQYSVTFFLDKDRLIMCLGLFFSTELFFPWDKL